MKFIYKTAHANYVQSGMGGPISSLLPGFLTPQLKLFKTQETFNIKEPENLRLTLQEITLTEL